MIALGTVVLLIQNLVRLPIVLFVEPTDLKCSEPSIPLILGLGLMDAC